MPTYDYKCDSCGEEFEHFQHITEDPLKKCPRCGKNSAKRLIGGGAGLIFKGSGFYITDYKNKGSDKKAEKETAKKETQKKDKVEKSSDKSGD